MAGLVMERVRWAAGGRRSRLCRRQLGSAAPKHAWWTRFTAIAGHHVALAWVLNIGSHNSGSVACFGFARFEGKAPVKAINKKRIGQAGAVDSHLHTLTAVTVIVVCIDIAPICT